MASMVCGTWVVCGLHYGTTARASSASVRAIKVLHSLVLRSWNAWSWSFAQTDCERWIWWLTAVSPVCRPSSTQANEAYREARQWLAGNFESVHWIRVCTSRFPSVCVPVKQPLEVVIQSIFGFGLIGLKTLHHLQNLNAFSMLLSRISIPVHLD